MFDRKSTLFMNYALLDKRIKDKNQIEENDDNRRYRSR